MLKPGATLGLIWNLRDERVKWMGQIGIVMRQSEAERFRRDEFVIGAPFPTEVF